MDSQMKNPKINPAELNDATLEEVAGGLNLGAAPASDTISPDEQPTQRKRCCKPRLKKEIDKAVEKEPDKATHRFLKETTDKMNM